MKFDGSNRASLAKDITSAARADIDRILAQDLNGEHEAQRIGFTGPPGSGKSTLIASWAERRLERGRSVGVLAIDPTSPISQGAILGDRIRMDPVDTQEKFFIRSVASTRLHDGLCHNALGILDVFDRYGFDDAVLETVGVGQTECNIRFMTGTVVLVLPPNSGDVIQAMKAGILEIADIYVVNKSDLPGSGTLTRELESVLSMRSPTSGWCLPPPAAGSKNSTPRSTHTAAGTGKTRIAKPSGAGESSTSLGKSSTRSSKRFFGTRTLPATAT